ncbi:MAG TPA: glycoside hydrolase family 9 protein, partial [Verrucomicrobiae bacterium]|nr:glycoside hydrolase family 9 protein [Verrucomicrobiae bacterium]
NAAASHFPFVNKGTVDVSGGHFDAGDYSKYTIDVTLLIHHLIFTVDNMPGVKDLDNLGIPESGDGISDVMQEAKWESDFLAKMQDADGGFYFLVYPLDRPYELDVLPDHGDAQVVFPKNTSATASSVAALAEMASSPTFKAAYPQTAALYLQKAILGWQFLTNAFNKYGRTGAYQKVTFYGDTFGDQDEVAWAAAALYTATGDPVYDNDLRAHTPNPNDSANREWGWLSMYASYGCAFRDYAFAARSGRLASNKLNAAYLAACEGECRLAATNAMNYSAKMAYGSSFSDQNKGPRVGGWYFSGEQTFDLATAYQLEAKPDYLDVVLKNYNYELGCNPLNQSFVTGLGWKRQREIVDQYAQNDYRTLPPSGIPLGNIQSSFDYLQNYGGELNEASFPSDSSATATYPYYDRWSDTFNTTTEFSTYQQAKSLAAAAMLMAASSVKTQAWRAQAGFISAVPINPTPVSQPITVSPNIAGLDLSKARIVWEARDQDPCIGATFTFAPKNAGIQWLEMEAQMPDGRRVFALTNFFAAQMVTNVIENYQTAQLATDTNVLAWYSLDNTTVDAKGHEAAATLVGNASFDTNSFTWNNRPNGAAVRVLDMGDKVIATLPSTDLFQSGKTKEISIEAMIYVNQLMSYSRGNVNLCALTKAWNAQLSSVENMWIVNPYVVGGNATIASGYAITNYLTPGAWQYLKISLTATNYSVQINGIQTANVLSTDLLNWVGTGPVNIELGNFKGWVDEIVVKTYNTVQSGTTITQPKIASLTRVGSSMSLKWSAASTSEFQVQWTPSLPATTWSVFTNMVTSTDGNFSFTDSAPGGGATGSRFYRLVQLR